MALHVRLPTVERLVGVPISEIEEAHLDQLCRNAVAEGQHLDYKEVPGPFLGTEDERQEFAKDVCAFANAAGGLIVYGVVEAAGVASALSPFVLPADVEQRAKAAGILAAWCRPAPAFDLDVVDTGSGKSYVLLAVPPSPNAPHGVVSGIPKSPRSGEVWMMFPYRYESTTRYLAEHELARRYEARFKTRADRIATLRSITPLLPSVLRNSAPDVVHLGVACVPVAEAVGRMSAAVARQWAEELADFDGRADVFGCRPQMTGRSTQFVQRGVRLGVRAEGSAIELHTDGSSVFELQLDAPSRDQTAELGHRVPLDVRRVMVDLAAALSFAAKWAYDGCGATGGMLVHYGLRSRTDQGTRREFCPGLRAYDGRFQPYSIALGGYGTDTETTVEIESLLGPPSQLHVAEWHRIAAEPLRALGLPEPPLTTDDGEIKQYGWLGEDQERVVDWAKLYGIPVDPSA